jgi:MarR family transcriptional regulator, temperature-dependent positive regulator of motility
MSPTNQQMTTINNPLSDILDGVSIPFAYKLGYVINSYRESSFRSIEAKFGLTRPEILSLIFLCYKDGISASDICDFSGHLKNNISRAVTALEGKGLIRREPDKFDSRRLVIYITTNGRKLHGQFMPGLQLREQEMMNCLSAKEQNDMTRLLRKLCNHTQNWSSTNHI